MLKLFSSLLKCVALAIDDTLTIDSEKSKSAQLPCFARASRCVDVVVFKNTALNDAVSNKRRISGESDLSSQIVDPSNFTLTDVVRGLRGFNDIVVGRTLYSFVKKIII